MHFIPLNIWFLLNSRGKKKLMSKPLESFSPNQKEMIPETGWDILWKYFHRVGYWSWFILPWEEIACIASQLRVQWCHNCDLKAVRVGGSIYTSKVSKSYKSGLLLSESVTKHSPAQHYSCSTFIIAAVIFSVFHFPTLAKNLKRLRSLVLHVYSCISNI